MRSLLGLLGFAGVMAHPLPAPPMSFGYPHTPLFYRRLDRPYRRAARAEGCWIEDDTGKRYLDASGGALVANLGHGIPEIAEAMAQATRELTYVNGTQFTNRWAEELAVALARHLPQPLRFSYFLASGSEAIEAAVKLARQFFVDSGRPSKWKVISLVPSYHGNTLAALALSGREHYRAPFAPLLLDFPRVLGPDPYRDPAGPSLTPELLAAEIGRQGADTVAAVIAEPIGGAASGARVPPPDYFPGVRALCDRHQILWIADEVLCGMGRTGRWLGSEHVGATPDILVLGKGLNGGAAPLSAVVTTPEIVAAVARGHGAFLHAQTYSHTPAICAAGVATVRLLEERDLIERVAALEAPFFGALDGLREHPWVGDVRGKGLLAGIELVADRGARRCFPRAARLAERVTERAFERGLIVWPNTGHFRGEGDLLMLGPPFTVREAEISEVVRRLGAALDEVAAEVGS